MKRLLVSLLACYCFSIAANATEVFDYTAAPSGWISDYNYYRLSPEKYFSTNIPIAQSSADLRQGRGFRENNFKERSTPSRMASLR